MASFEPDNPARPPAGVRLCALDEIKDPGGKSFRFRDGTRMFAGFVIREGEAARGYVDSCPHAGWPRSMGTGFSCGSIRFPFPR